MLDVEISTYDNIWMYSQPRSNEWRDTSICHFVQASGLKRHTHCIRARSICTIVRCKLGALHQPCSAGLIFAKLSCLGSCLARSRGISRFFLSRNEQNSYQAKISLQSVRWNSGLLDRPSSGERLTGVVDAVDEINDGF